MTTDDPDGFDEARRNEVFLRMVAVKAQPERDALVAALTPLELAEHDLAGIIEMQRQYEAGETSSPVTDSNTRAMAELVAELRAAVDRLRGDG
jgi:hypothetical protein